MIDKPPVSNKEVALAVGLPADSPAWGSIAVERESLTRVRWRAAVSSAWLSPWISSQIAFAWLSKWDHLRLEIFGLFQPLPELTGDSQRWWIVPSDGTEPRPGDLALLVYLERALPMAAGEYRQPIVYAEYQWLPGLGRLSGIRNAQDADVDALKAARDGFTLLELFGTHRETRGRRRRIDDPSHPSHELLRQYHELRVKEPYLDVATCAYRLHLNQSTLERWLTEERRVQKRGHS